MAKAKKRLRIAIFHLAFVYSGGGERLVLEEATHLQKLGYDVTCFAPIVDAKRCFPELIQKVRVRKILPKILPDWFPDIELLSILTACLLVPLFFRQFENYDVYMGANQPGPWIAYLLSVFNRKPYVIYLAQPTRLLHPRFVDQEVGLRIRDGFTLLTFFRVLFRPVIYFFDMVSIRGAGLVFVNGSYAKGVIEGVYGIKAVNCPAGAEIQNSNFRVKRTDFRNKGTVRVNETLISKPYILVTNRHFAQKKFEYAIEAWKRLEHHKISLVITGKETEYTRRLKEQYRSAKRLFFVGLVSEKELDKLYTEASVYVYPAPEEDFGMGIVEAMAKGVPVVAWGNAGPTGIISHGRDGYLAKPFEIRDLSEGIRLCLVNVQFANELSRAGREKVESFFSFRKHVELLDQQIRKYLDCL